MPDPFEILKVAPNNLSLAKEECKTHNGHRHFFISNPIGSENDWVPADQPSITIADMEGFTFNLDNIFLFHQGFFS